MVIGTYDPQKHRARILLEGLRARGVPIHEINVGIWQGVRDKGMLTPVGKLGAALRQLVALPRLALAYLRAPAHDTVLIPYPGIAEAVVLTPVAALRGARVAWDLFISPYDTLVHDRRTHRAFHPLALALLAMEWLAARLVTWPFLDTGAHARRFERLMGLPHGRVGSAPLGTDPARFPPRRAGHVRRPGPLRLLFYGQYIPLHGMETIIRAAWRLQHADVAVEFMFAGTGQEQARVDALIAELGLRNLRQLGWIEPQRLPELMHDADLGLGIFGQSEKACSVVPNKAYEMAAAQLPFVSGDTPALAEFAPGHPWVLRVPPGDDAALANAIARVATAGLPPADEPLPVVGPPEVADAVLALLERRP